MKPLPKHLQEDLVNRGHWEAEDYVQRCERKVWAYILLYKRDTLPFQGRQRQLEGKSIGAGVWEVRKKKLEV